MTRPEPAAVALAAPGVIIGGACAIAGWRIPALICAGVALAVLALYWQAPHDPDIDALITAITCRACRPDPSGPCTCGRDCGDLRCDQAPREPASANAKED